MTIQLKVLYADTAEGLCLKMLGYNHDHCIHYYVGKVQYTPSEYEYVVDSTEGNYVFIYSE